MLLAGLAFLFVMSGCATVGKDFSSEGVKQLTIGKTSENEVLQTFGEPSSRQDRSENNNQFKLLRYSYAKGTVNSGKGRSLTAEFKDGVLNAYLFQSALEGDSTDFNFDAINKARQKGLRLDEIVSLMGRPTGEVRFPSLLLRNEFGTMPEIIPPADASSAFVYFHLEVKREDKLLKKHLKLFLVYTRPAGSVIETRYFNGTL